MKNCFLPLLVALSIVASCKDPLEEATPSMLKLSTEKLSDEPGTEHNVTFKVTCDKPFDVTPQDAPWLSLVSIGEAKNNISLVTLSLEANSGDESRSGKVAVTAGKMSAELSVTQSTIANLLPADHIELVNLQPASLAFKFPAAWTVSCTDANGAPASWFSADATGGIADVTKTVSFRASGLNYNEAPRTGGVIVSLPGIELRIAVSQPMTDILGPDYGIYNYDGKGASWLYKPYEQQLSTLHRPGGQGEFRIIAPVENGFLLFQDVPSQAAPGDKVRFLLVQNVLQSYDYQTQLDAEIAKVEADKIWLVDGETCYVLKP